MSFTKRLTDNALYHSNNDDTITIEEKEDVEPLIELNKEQRNQVSGFKGTFRHVARIPAVVVSDLMRRGIWDDPVALKRWLNDPDNRAFRTHPGRV